MSVGYALAALLCGLFLLMSCDRSLIQSSIARSHAIETQFLSAARFVDEFLAKNERLPTQEEFRAWAAPDKALRPGSSLMLWIGPFEPETEAKGGHAPPNGYILAYWRGEWMEKYFSWTGRSTLQFDPDAYFLFDSQLAQISLALGVTIFFAGMCAREWSAKRVAA